jgi:hypothetical protein
MIVNILFKLTQRSLYGFICLLTGLIGGFFCFHPILAFFIILFPPFSNHFSPSTRAGVWAQGGLVCAQPFLMRGKHWVLTYFSAFWI